MLNIMLISACTISVLVMMKDSADSDQIAAGYTLGLVVMYLATGGR